LPNGNDRLILQERDRRILTFIAERRIMDRDQIAALAPFTSTTRTNVRLGKLRCAGLVARYFTASQTGSRRSLFSLTRKGSETLERPHQAFKWKLESVIIGNAFSLHQLAVTDVYISAQQQAPSNAIRWRTFNRPLSATTKLIPDGLIEYDNSAPEACALFLEVDLGTEPMPTWTKKVQQYIRLAETREFKDIAQANRFAVLVIANSADRSQLLRKHIARQTSKLFWFTTLDIIKQRGFWSPIWARPTGDQLVPPGA
jgi:hypothetical protein